jgi:predicted GH43/DUF377 family glycosyl hydrolase
MKNRWNKIGKIYNSNGEKPWLYSHASVPTVELLEKDLIKIYFSSRDVNNESFVNALVIDLNRPKNILDFSTAPILKPGNIGTFDESGAMATWFTKYKNLSFLYYVGWNKGFKTPFRNAIGLAVSENGAPFKKHSFGPIVDRSAVDPFFTASCCVLPDDDNWRMYYLSCTDWRVVKNSIQHRYHIKYAESIDGINWIRNGVVAIDYSNNDEYAISRPSVIKDKECWKMWYSYRGDYYKIGYAESNDGIVWERQDNQWGLNLSESGWDSEMVEYPCVFDHSGVKYLLYNGNGYGQTGFGLAECT